MSDSLQNSLSAKVENTNGKFCALLLDTQDASGALGGTGKAFDWSIAASMSGRGNKFFLAGGLNPDNVQTAVSCAQPFGVDVSSGVERSPGVKDLECIRKFIINAKM